MECLSRSTSTHENIQLYVFSHALRFASVFTEKIDKIQTTPNTRRLMKAWHCITSNRLPRNISLIPLLSQKHFRTFLCSSHSFPSFNHAKSYVPRWISSCVLWNKHVRRDAKVTNTSVTFACGGMENWWWSWMATKLDYVLSILAWWSRLSLSIRPSSR